MASGRGSHGEPPGTKWLRSSVGEVAILRGEGAIDRGTLLERQGFGTNGGLDVRFVKRGFQRGFGIFGAQVIPECLALLSERDFQEVDETCFGNLQAFQ